MNYTYNPQLNNNRGGISTQDVASDTIGLYFLKRIVPSGNFVYCASRKKEQEEWNDKVCFSLDEVSTTVLANSSSGYNTYFGLSAFVNGWHHDSGKHKRVFRTRENAYHQKAFWLDIDLYPKSRYHNTNEALQDLLRFIRIADLPDPTIIHSGNGLHVYWPLTYPVTTKQWAVMSGMLHSLVTHHRFDVDPHRTQDPASVLRVPGTWNFDKVDGTAKPVQVMLWSPDYSPEQLATAMFNNIVANNLPIEPSRQLPKLKEHGTFIVDAPAINDQQRNKLNQSRAAFIDTPKDSTNIFKECQQMREAWWANYDTWRNALGVLKFCENGLELAKHYSAQCTDTSKYKGAADVENKFAELQRGGRGPSYCSTFNKDRAGICLACRHWKSNITNPLMLANDVESEPPPPPIQASLNDGLPVVTEDSMAQYNSLGVIPFKNRTYEVREGVGIIWKRRVNTEDGEDVSDDIETVKSQTRPTVICESELYLTCIHIDTTEKTPKRNYVVCKKTPGQPVEYINYDVETCIGRQQFVKWCANHGILPTNPGFEGRMFDFMRTMLGMLQNKLTVVRVKDHFGWAVMPDANGINEDTFILGNNIYSYGAVRPTNLSTRCQDMAEREFQQCGTLENWKLIPKMYRTLNQQEAMFFMCVAFAAPFMKFGNATATNAILNLYAPHGGEGKTTLLQAVNSVWGNPSGLMLDKADTLSARYQVLGTRRNIPICMDEITVSTEEELAKMLFTISSGRENRKSQSSGKELVRTGHWETITIFSSNRSLYEAMKQWSPQSQAPSMRAMDIYCNFQSYSGTVFGEYIEHTISLLKTNFGLAGPEFLNFCFSKPGLFKELPNRAMAWDKQHRKHSDERFWTYPIGLIIEAGKLAVEAGLLDYDMNGVETYAQFLLERLRLKVKDNKDSGLAILADFFSENTSKTLVVTHNERPTEYKDPGTMSTNILDRYVLHFPLHELAIRNELDTNTLFVRVTYLHKWCGQRHLSVDALLQDLARSGAWNTGDKMQMRLGRGVKSLKNIAATVYKFNGNKLILPEEWRAHTIVDQIKESLHV